MRFKIDEHLPLEIKDLLVQHRHDPVTVAEEGMAGSIDPDVAQVCLKVIGAWPFNLINLGRGFLMIVFGLTLHARRTLIG